MQINKVTLLSILTLISVNGWTQDYNSDYEKAVQATIKRNKEIEESYQNQVKNTINTNQNLRDEEKKVYQRNVDNAIKANNQIKQQYENEVKKEIYLNNMAEKQSDKTLLKEVRSEIKNEETQNLNSIRNDSKSETKDAEKGKNGFEITLDQNGSTAIKNGEVVNSSDYIKDNINNVQTIENDNKSNLNDLTVK